MARNRRQQNGGEEAARDLGNGRKRQQLPNRTDSKWVRSSEFSNIPIAQGYAFILMGRSPMETALRRAVMPGIPLKKSDSLFSDAQELTADLNEERWDGNRHSQPVHS
ncbi:hypothetical protein lerEdw1_006509 [Lerista edwardsae]|nr:hypothetical protein lerEdw1_006509 [Lerista edwardsae]